MANQGGFNFDFGLGVPDFGALQAGQGPRSRPRASKLGLPARGSRRAATASIPRLYGGAAAVRGKPVCSAARAGRPAV